MVDIKGYEGKYAVTRDGQIYAYPSRRLPNGGFLKQRIVTNSVDRLRARKYYAVGLWLAGARKSMQVHRLVAMAYISNPNSRPDVNHIDGNPLNNCVENLEWVTKSENMRHAQDNGLLTQDSLIQQTARKIAGLKSKKNLKHQTQLWQAYNPA